MKKINAQFLKVLLLLGAQSVVVVLVLRGEKILWEFGRIFVCICWQDMWRRLGMDIGLGWRLVMYLPLLIKSSTR